jgi:diguanylate cyclase (GGDEF)-like protein
VDFGAAATIRSQVLLDPRTLAGVAALVIAALLTLLYSYRRRLFIVYWVAAWLLLAGSFGLAGHSFANVQIGWMAYGMAQFVAIAAALTFVVAADAYGHRPRFRRAYTLTLMPIAIWFAFAPVALGPVAAFAPGHLLIAGGFTAAGVAHLLVVRRVRLLGAVIVGASLLGLAALNVWVTVTGSAPEPPPGGPAQLITTVVFLFCALGMQLMTFEDMTYELRRSHRRLEAARNELRELAITDQLTGCRNRRFFEEVIGRELRRHERYNLPLSILFVDLDRFKAVNDTLGHETGDRVLRDTARFLLKNVRDADYVFRWGGDEFLILITAPSSEARRRGAQLQAAFAAEPGIRNMPPGFALSVGCVEVPSGTRDIMPLVEQADQRMYADKKRK